MDKNKLDSLNTLAAQIISMQNALSIIHTMAATHGEDCFKIAVSYLPVGTVTLLRESAKKILTDELAELKKIFAEL